MNRAAQFRAFTQALARDHKLAVEMDTILRRAQALNIDFRGRARQRLRERVQLLVNSLNRHCVFLRNLDPDARTAVNHLLFRAYKDVVAFGWALEGTVALDPEKEPELDALIAVRWLLAESMTVAATLAEVVTRPASLPASQLIARVGARLLPWEERQRYLDEYLSELDELARESSRRAQLGHALRLLVRVPALRWELKRASETQLYAYRETR